MNIETKTVDTRGRVEASRREFSGKTNPNWPTAIPVGPVPHSQGEVSGFADRTDPRHSRTPLTEDRRALAEQYMPMARAMARQFGCGPAWQEDMEAEAFAALVDAARTFNPGRGVDFSVHARPRITGALRDYKRFLFHAGFRGQFSKSPVFRSHSITDDTRGTFLGIEADAPPGREIDCRDSVEDILRRLPRTEAMACRSLYVEGKSAEETARELGCSRGHLSRLHNGALERIRRVYCENIAV